MDTWTTLLILRSYHCWNLKLVGHHLIHYHWHQQQKHHNIHNCHISGFCKSAVFLNGRKNVWDTMCLLWRPTRGEDADFADKLFIFVFYPHIVFTKNCFFYLWVHFPCFLSFPAFNFFPLARQNRRQESLRKHLSISTYTQECPKPHLFHLFGEF